MNGRSSSDSAGEGGGGARGPALVEPASESAASIRHLIRTAARHGLALDEGPTAPQPVLHARVSARRADALWERAVRALGPALPLLVADKPADEHLSPLFFAAASCRTLGDALGLAARHWRYVTGALPATLIRRAGTVQLRLELGAAAPLGARVRAEYLLANLARAGRELGGGAFRPAEVVLWHRPPIALDRWEEACGAPARVDPRAAGLVMEEGSLAQPVRPGPWPAAGRFVLEVLDWCTPRAQPPRTVAERVAEILARDLGAASPTLEQVAHHLAVSARSLNRQLAAEGTSYLQVRDDLRRDRAIRHLLDERYPLKAIAASLGFSDLRGFRRAFKRWTGVTPQRFRDRA